MLATFGVSDAGDISEEQAHYFIIFLKALVQMGNLRGGVVTGTVSEADALETTESVHYGSIPGSLGVAGSC